MIWPSNNLFLSLEKMYFSNVCYYKRAFLGRVTKGPQEAFKKRQTLRRTKAKWLFELYFLSDCRPLSEKKNFSNSQLKGCRHFLQSVKELKCTTNFHFDAIYLTYLQFIYRWNNCLRYLQNLRSTFLWNVGML